MIRQLFACAVFLVAASLAGCGGGAAPEASAQPQQLRVATPRVLTARVPGANGVVVQLYQALYGMAPGYTLLNSYSTQADADAAGFAISLAANFATTSDANLAALVLKNLNVSATTVGAATYSVLSSSVSQLFGVYGAGSRGVIILNLTNILAGLEADANYGVAAAGFNTLVLADFNYSTVPANLAAKQLVLPTVNVAPVAFAGLPQLVFVGKTVLLDGSASGDANGDFLTYAWTLVSKPAGSNAVLGGSTTNAPSFTADVLGTYTLALTVSDGKLSSQSSVAVDAIAMPGATVPLYLYGGAANDVYLGCISCNQYQPDSVCNPTGAFGTTTGTYSIWNPTGVYGNPQSAFSPWNASSVNGPAIIGGDGIFYGYFTTNAARAQRIGIFGYANTLNYFSAGNSLPATRTFACTVAGAS